jgi:hypothetical protein
MVGKAHDPEIRHKPLRDVVPLCRQRSNPLPDYCPARGAHSMVGEELFLSEKVYDGERRHDRVRVDYRNRFSDRA